MIFEHLFKQEKFYERENPGGFQFSAFMEIAGTPTLSRPMLEQEAKERQRNHGGTAPGRPKQTLTPQMEEVTNPCNTESAEQAAALLGIGKTRIYDMEKIMRDAPEKVEAIRKGELQRRPASGNGGGFFVAGSGERVGRGKAAK